MKKTSILLAFAFAAGGPALGQKKSANPFEDEEFLAAAADEKFPETWEVMWEVFSVPFADAAKMRREAKDQKKMYADLVRRVEKKDAVLEVFELNKVLFGLKCKSESIEEFIYPTEYEPPELPNIVRKVPNNPEVARMLQTPATPTAFDTKNVGLSLNIDRMEGRDGGVSLEIELTRVFFKELEKWGQKKSSVEMPRFEVQQIKRGMRFRDGQPMLVGTMSPMNEKGRRVWLAFATATSSKN